jgi:hypothetical protein
MRTYVRLAFEPVGIVVVCLATDPGDLRAARKPPTSYAGLIVG